MNKLIKGNINVVRVEQLPGRDGKPGGIKIQLPNKNAKIEVLRAKKSLVKTADYSQVTLCDILLPQHLIYCRNIGVFYCWDLALSTWEINRVALWKTLAFHSQRNDSMVLISSTDLSHFSISTCASPFFSKFQHVAYQSYFSLIVMYKTVFSSHHVDVVSMTETAWKLIQLALVGCGLWHREVKVEKCQLIYCSTLPSSSLTLMIFGT